MSATGRKAGGDEAILPAAASEPEPEPEPEPPAAVAASRRSATGDNGAGGGARYVRLNVGGTPYMTLLTTLTKHPRSMLAAMFSSLEEEEEEEEEEEGEDESSGAGMFSMPVDGTGAFIVDRDGASFRHILNYLRNDGPTPPPLPASADERQLLAMEAEYFLLEELLDRCRSVGQQGRVMYPMSQAEFLSQPLREGMDNVGNAIKVVSLPPVDLRGVTMAHQSYVGCSFRECDLREVDMRKATLRCTDLQDARCETQAPLTTLCFPGICVVDRLLVIALRTLIPRDVCC